MEDIKKNLDTIRAATEKIVEHLKKEESGFFCRWLGIKKVTMPTYNLFVLCINSLTRVTASLADEIRNLQGQHEALKDNFKYICVASKRGPYKKRENTADNVKKDNHGTKS